MNIFFDLDGTLIDSRERLYQVFQFLVPNSNMSFNEYWDLKRNKINHKEILTNKFNYSDEQFKVFELDWMNNIEKEEWLDLDVPFEGVSDLLNALYKKYTLFVVTARQSETLAIQQIKKFGWEHYFKQILVTCQKQEKLDLIKKSTNVNDNDWFIGDTGKDIQTGKLLGINTAGVLTGFLNFQCLNSYNPNIIIEKVTDFKNK
jgi:phosphoglycolate phosphatase